MVPCHKRNTITGLVYLLLLPILAATMFVPVASAEPARLDLLTQDFEGIFPPFGWHVIHLGPVFSWSWTTAASHSPTHSAYVRPGFAGQEQDEWLVLVAMDFTTAAGPKIEWYEEEIDWDSDGGHHYLMVSTTSQTDPAAFEVVADMTPANHTVNGFDGDPVVVDLAAYAGVPNVYIALRYTGTVADYWFIDDLRVFNTLDAGSDVYPLSLAPSFQHFDPGQELIPEAVIQNDSAQNETFDVQMEIFTFDGAAVYDETLTVTDLESGTSANVTFPPFTVSGGNIYRGVVTTLLAGDLLPANDAKEVFNDSWTQSHVPMGILFTNAGCDPCVAVNQALDNYMPTQGNEVALMRVHVSWPGADSMYSANPTQSNSLVSQYGVGGVPNFFLDGAMDLGNPGGSVGGFINTQKLLKSPNTIDLAWNSDSDQLMVTIRNLEPSYPGSPYLKVAITEDDIHYQGSNGEPVHNQAMRRMYPDVDGIEVPTTLGNHQFIVDCPLNASWVYENLRATVYLQNAETDVISQAATNFLTEIDDPITAVGDEIAGRLVLGDNYPNPFNPLTTIKYSLPREQLVELSVYALDGRRVATLLRDVVPAGQHEIVWDGRDTDGVPVASGSYFYRLDAGDFSQTRQMMLVK